MAPFLCSPGGARRHEPRVPAGGACRHGRGRARPMGAEGGRPTAAQRCPEPPWRYYDARADGLSAPHVARVRLRLRKDGPRPDRPLGPGGHPGPSVGPREPRCTLSPALRTPRAPPREPQCTLSLALRATRPDTLTGTAVHTVTGPPRRVDLRARGGPRGGRDGANVTCTRGHAHGARARTGELAGHACDAPH